MKRTAAAAGFRDAGTDVHLRVELRRRPDREDFRVRRAKAALLSLPLQEEQPDTRLQMQKEATGLVSEREADDSHVTSRELMAAAAAVLSQ